MSMPRIAPACSSVSARSLASLMPPALPRPPIWTWALTTTGIAQLVRRLGRLCDSGGMAPLGHRHRVLGEELLALVFE